MRRRTCDDCNYYQTEVCPIYHHDLPFDACPNHISKRKLSLFDHIIQSPEVLAPCFVEKQPDKWDDDDYAYYSYLTKEWYATEYKAISATLAKLKDVYDETTSN